MLSKNKLNAYQKDSIKTQIAAADPYTIVTMLMAGCLERMAKGKGCITRNDLEGKSVNLSKASAIIQSLNQSLDMKVGGEVAQNLAAIYVRINDLITDASTSLKTEPLDEAMALLLEIKSGWDAIPQADVDATLASRS